MIPAARITGLDFLKVGDLLQHNKHIGQNENDSDRRIADPVIDVRSIALPGAVSEARRHRWAPNLHTKNSNRKARTTYADKSLLVFEVDPPEAPNY